MQAAEPTVLGHHIPWSFPRLEEGRFPSFSFSLSVFQKRHRSLTEAYINELNLFSDASALDWSLARHLELLHGAVDDAGGCSSAITAAQSSLPVWHP